MVPAPVEGPETSCAFANLANNIKAAKTMIEQSATPARCSPKRKQARRRLCVIQGILFWSESLEL
jgi:hypothetical protein